MTSSDPFILILLPWDPAIRLVYENLLRARFPALRIATVATLPDAAARIAQADVFMCFGVNITRDIFAAAPRLRWVHAFGTGVDGIVDQPGLGPDVVVTNTRGVHGTPLSELVILQMLALVRNLPRSLKAQEQHKWDRFRAKVISGKRAGILGVGAIAEDLAPRLSALGLEVVGITRSARNLPGFDEMRPREPLAAAVADLDFLILLIPLEPDTRDIIDAGVLAAMKRGSYLLNIARGGLVDEPALVAALTSGHLAGAALDTTAVEPLPADSPLWDCPNVIVTPHLGGFYDTYPEDSIDQIYYNLEHFRAGRRDEMINKVAR